MKAAKSGTLPLLLLYSLILALPQLSPNLIVLRVYEDGWVNVSYNISLQDPELIVYLPIYGSPSFLMVTDEEGLPLNASASGGYLEIHSLGSREISISYYTQDILDKKGAVWTLNLSPVEERALIILPNNANVVGMSDLPEMIITEEGGVRLIMPPEAEWISYVLTYPSAMEEAKEVRPLYLFLLPAILIIAVLVILRLKRVEKRKIDRLDVRILSELVSGGLYLKELAQRIERSKTTAWRRCRKLERAGLIKVIRRKDGNFIRLTEAGRSLVEEAER